MRPKSIIFFLFFFSIVYFSIGKSNIYAYASEKQDTTIAKIVKSSNQKIGLVLSGGGAKGLSHVGVLKALEENDIPIDYVCGTSMGAIVGALYSIGLSPDEMLYLFKTEEFEKWYNGLPEQGYATYFYEDDPSAKMFSFFISRKKGKLKVDIPTSLVSPYPMDLAVMQIFASPSDACGYDFNKLMLPFFCVSSDISKKSQKIHRTGDLGAAVRASMTFPFYFKPITIDSTVLFDGGFYNNFPWDIMENVFSPDFIIGSKCVRGKVHLDEEDVSAQVLNMLTVETDYDIPKEKGIVISREYPYNVMDFNKVDVIVELGYENAQAYVEQIKRKISKRRTKKELDSMRLAFRIKCGEVRFDKNIEITGTLNKTQRRFVSRTIRTDEMKEFDFNKFKRGYYRIIATKFVKTFYPSYERLNDSLYTLKIKASLASPFRISVGGNISSSSLNQGYFGVAYTSMAANPWKISADMNVGRYYTGGGLKFRYDVGVKPLAFTFFEFVAHQFDYFSGNQNFFTPDKFPNNAKNIEFFIRGGIATPLYLNKNILAKFSISMGENRYKYFIDDKYAKTDSKDLTRFRFISPSLSLYRNTQNYPIYPTEGRKGLIALKWIYGKEVFIPGSHYINSMDFSENNENIINHGYGGVQYGNVFAFGDHNYLQLKISGESFFKVFKWLNIGYNYEISLSKENLMANYLSSIMYMPVFEPNPHSKTLLLKGYRANNFIGFGISPVILFTKTLFLHTNLSYFQPYSQIYEKEKGEYGFTNPFPKGAFIGNIAFVWQSLVGPISFSVSYYEKGEYKKLYPQLNIGFLLFKKKALEN